MKTEFSRKGNKMNKIERLEFISSRMRDGLHFKSLETPNGKYRFDSTQKLHYIENGFKDVSTLSIDKLLDYDLFLIPLNHSFTDEELTIMKHLPYSYLIRDGNGDIYHCKFRPKKLSTMWVAGEEYVDILWLGHLFPTIRFENDEPVNIEDYI